MTFHWTQLTPATTGRLVALVSAFVVALSVVVVATGARAAVEIKEVVSDKGVRAWLVEDYTVPIVTMRFAFRGGSTQDPEGKEGLANLMTGLFDEGAGDLDSDAFQKALDEAGAEMSFDQSRDELSGSIRMLAETREKAFDLLRLAVNDPRFDPAPVDRIRAQIVSGIIADSRNPSTLAQIAFNEALFGDHPYARRDEGTAESLATVTPDDLKTAREKMFGRDNLYVAVVGAIDPEDLKRELDRVFGDLREKADLAPVADIQPNLGQETRLDYPVPQTTLRLAYPGMVRQNPEYFAAYLMNHMLGGGTFSSRLFEEVREKRGLVYGISSYIVNFDHATALMIGTGTAPDKAEETLAIIRDEVRRMAEEGPTEDELREAKDYVLGAYAINNLDSSSSIARTLVDIQVNDLGIDYIDRRVSLINSVTLDQVKAAAKLLLDAEPAVMIMGPQTTNGG